ncbi:MAG: methylmalonyl-CoA epimerase [Bradymonadaceae bacterium]|nr:methylmalonyl-CoA epimerase [Lujinxingiaceae bacterium]
MIEKIDHIGIAVRSIEERLPLYRDVLGLEYLGEEIVAEQGVRVAFLKIGEAMIELLEPLDETGPIARFLAKNGEGIHHLAARCTEIGAGRNAIEAAGLRLLSDRPLDGAHGKLISFVHPKDTGGVLLELTQRRAKETDQDE